MYMLLTFQDRIAAFQLLATMYIKYIQIFRRLEQAYDQIVHPQKRRILRHVLDGVMGRVLELKNEMVNLELSEYHYFDDVLSDLKLTPVGYYLLILLLLLLLLSVLLVLLLTVHYIAAQWHLFIIFKKLIILRLMSDLTLVNNFRLFDERLASNSLLIQSVKILNDQRLKIISFIFQNDVEMPIPKYFVLERAKALKEREKLLSQILSRLGSQDKDVVCH